MKGLENNRGKIFLIPTLLSENTHSSVLPTNFIDVIKPLKHFFAEDVRSARRFLSSLKAEIVIDELNFTVLNKDTQAKELTETFNLIKNGINFGLLSEAGCPGIADPGALAVKIAHDNNIEVMPLVGPSSILLSLMASGFSGQNFEFHGYLPIDKSLKIKSLQQLEKESLQKNKTQIFIETPYRNDILFQDIIQNCKQNTHLCIAKDITGANQMIKTLTIKDWKYQKVELNKIPCVFLLFAQN